ncbi:hypothetical protein E8E12_007331 [Didymella heteroderae]|uniref:Uncharacterized protein n=1 Tax=Didymella heteroderae TaxID=1769908 RepID=A0A9P4WQ75_9PLEO|nr:hypothetical protein E8E12_007331 [Didymella heteroderae]
MVQLEDLTVGQVSGMIAAAVFMSLRTNSTASNTTGAAPLSLSLCNGDRGVMVCHQPLPALVVMARHPQNRLTISANRSTLFMSWIRIFMLVLIAVAAIVTPLGLYEGLVAETESTLQTFRYIKDPSTFGLGTPPRTAVSGTWSRICGAFTPFVCPNSSNQLTEFGNSTGSHVSSEYYSSKVPSTMIEGLHSGLAGFEPSVAGPFDIQYRSYVQSEIDNDERGVPIDNGTTPYTKGTYQPISTGVLSDAYLAIEGLVVDMKNGGIGFRNHSSPPPRAYGSSWSEDLLFTAPETVCVDTNLTLDFVIPSTMLEILSSGASPGSAFRLNLTDRGGFVNLNRTYPEWERGDTQQNPELWLRAYKAAWFNNALTMAFMNVTNVVNETTHLQAFSYLSSTMNKTFPLHYPGGEIVSRMLIVRPSSLQVSASFGGYLHDLDVGQSNVSTFGNATKEYDFPSKLPVYNNPFNISTSFSGSRMYNNFSAAELVCAGSGDGDLANITNMVGKCGLLYGTPRRQDGSASLLFEPSSAWTLPMYSCMSVVKASIKTVSFLLNGTDGLSGITIQSIEEKKYLNEESRPLWAVENSDMPLAHGNPLWGIVAPEVAARLNVSTVRKDELYLPGYAGKTFYLGSHENLPSADFAAQALGSAYQTGQTTSTSDYSGSNNLALFRLWQEYSRTAPTSAKILNLIWTDLAANLVLGTKGLHFEPTGSRKRDATAVPESKMPKVTSYTRRVKYKYVYGIPAFFALALTTMSALATTYFTIFGHARPSTMRAFLQHTSAGRLLSAQSNHTNWVARTDYRGHASPEQEPVDASEPTKDWISGNGKEEFTLSSEGWTRNMQPHGPGYDKAGTTASYAPVPTSHAY